MLLRKYNSKPIRWVRRAWRAPANTEVRMEFGEVGAQVSQKGPVVSLFCFSLFAVDLQY